MPDPLSAPRRPASQRLPAGLRVLGLVVMMFVVAACSAGAGLLQAGPRPPRPLAPSAGAVLPQNNLEHECTVYGVSWQFDWEPVSGAARYQVEVDYNGEVAPVYSQVYSTEASVRVARCGCFDQRSLNGWDWRVRAADATGAWGSWSQPTPFAIQPFIGCQKPHEEQ